MDIKIDILQKKQNYERIEKVFKIGRIIVGFIGILTLGSLVTLFILISAAQKSYDNKMDERDKLKIQLDKLRIRETEILLLNGKTNLYFDIIETSPKYSEMYKVLEDNLPQASESGTVKSYVFNTENDIDVVLLFTEQDSLSAFLSYIEKADFKNKFDYIGLDGISLADKEAIAEAQGKLTDKAINKPTELSLHLKIHETTKN